MGLVNKLLFLFGAVALYRFGIYVPVLGVSVDSVSSFFDKTDSTFMGLFNIFSGGALSQLSIFSLGIVPYISASIAMQLLQHIVPSLKAISKDGSNGRKVINQYTRFLTLAVAFFQAFALCSVIRADGIFLNDSGLLFFAAVVNMTAGAVFLMWLGEKINEKGIGNGMSMLVFVSIVASLPTVIMSSVEQARVGSISFLAVGVILLLLLVLSLVIVFFERAQRKIPLGHANKNFANASMMNNQFLPLKINMSGVIPAIFASSILLLPYSLSQWMGTQFPWLNQVAVIFSPNQPLYLVIYVMAIFFFCFFYVSLVVNTSEISKNLKQANSFILGVRPGEATEHYLDKVVGYLTFVGAIYISVVSLFPQLLSIFINVPFIFAGTSILIVITVSIDFINQVQSHLFSAQYATILNKTGFGKKNVL